MTVSESAPEYTGTDQRSIASEQTSREDKSIGDQLADEIEGIAPSTVSDVIEALEEIEELCYLRARDLDVDVSPEQTGRVFAALEAHRDAPIGIERWSVSSWRVTPGGDGR